jgi:hypothetical protein
MWACQIENKIENYDCGHDVKLLTRVDGVDKSLECIGAIMQQILCQTMKMCSINKKFKVALETAEIAPSAQRIAPV